MEEILLMKTRWCRLWCLAPWALGVINYLVRCEGLDPNVVKPRWIYISDTANIFAAVALHMRVARHVSLEVALLE